MRLILFTALILLSFSIPSFAQEKSLQEGAGLLTSDLKGALPKALWSKQPRSEITYLLKNLPADGSMRSIQKIKRDMLLSRYDTSLIDNDIDIKSGDDLLTLRLQKLMEMGLWENAFTLFTRTTRDPEENDALAQIGVMLLLTQKGLSTACLENKVLNDRFPDTPFWEEIDLVCAAEMETESIIGTQFSESSVLQAIYNEPDFLIPTDNMSALKKLTPLELAVVSLKKRIDYQSLDLSNNIPPHIIKTFLNDPNFPKGSKESLEKQAREKYLHSESPFSAEEQEQIKDLSSLSQEQLLSLLSHKLSLGQKITQEESLKLEELAPENPRNYVYLQLLKDINATHFDLLVSEDNFNLGLTSFAQLNAEKVNLLKTKLDKSPEFSNNPVNVYEKQVGLTPDGDYVMPTEELTKWLKRTKEHQFVGLSLLIILSNIEKVTYAENSGNILEDTTINVLESLSIVGLIEQANHIASEELVKMMRL